MKISKNIPKQPGVYCVTNLINNKFYIGSSKNLYRRYYNHRESLDLKMFQGMPVLCRAYQKYGIENFEFKVIKITDEYYKWEELFINLLNPEYNISKMFNGKIQPNLGKKFNQKWIDKIKRTKPHSEETIEILSKLNKKNACKLKFIKEDEILEFNSWVDANKYFNVNSTTIQVSFKRWSEWRDWKIEKISTQKKRVILDNHMEFESSYQCDRYLNLWRGCTSNAIINNNGYLHEHLVRYL